MMGLFRCKVRFKIAPRLRLNTMFVFILQVSQPPPVKRKGGELGLSDSSHRQGDPDECAYS